jgi:hypothetical protein
MGGKLPGLMLWPAKCTTASEMYPHILATVYPGGAIAVLSALLWLVLTVASILGFMIGCCLICFCSMKPMTAVKTLRFGFWTSVLALVFLSLEQGSIAWDACFILDDRAYILDEAPTNLGRAALNAVSSVVCWLLLKFGQKRTLIVGAESKQSV